MEDPRCSTILTKGKRKGSLCERRAIYFLSSGNRCKFHAVKTEPTQTCSMILTKGLRKTETCNRKVYSDAIDVNDVSDVDESLCETVEHRPLCKMHRVLESKKPLNPYRSHETDFYLKNSLVTSDDGLVSLDIGMLNSILAGTILGSGVACVQ